MDIPNSDMYPVYAEHVYEQPVGYPNGEEVLLEDGRSSVYSRVMNAEYFARNAHQRIVSLNSDFSGATWETLTRTGTVTATADGATTVYVKYRNPGMSESPTASDSITIDTSLSDRWDDIMDKIGSKIMDYYPTYKIASDDRNIQRYVVGDMAEAQLSDKLPILFVEFGGINMEFTDDSKRVGTFERFEVSLHVACIDDVNEQAYKAKNLELLRTLQGVARVCYNKRNLDGVVSRITVRRAERTSFSSGEGRSIATGRIVADILFTNTSI
jgi:hypothetical protein